MSIYYNGTKITAIKYNGTTLTQVNYNGTKIWPDTKAAGSVTTKPTAKSLSYNGSGQELVTAGAGTGTMMYKAANSTVTTYSSTIPKATNAGTYTVYYYAAESTNYAASAEGSVSVTIAKIAGAVTLSATSGTMAAAETSKQFTVSTNKSGGTLSATSSNTSICTVSVSGTTVTCTRVGSSAGTATITVKSAATTNYNQATATYTLAVTAATKTAVIYYTNGGSSLSNATRFAAQIPAGISTYVQPVITAEKIPEDNIVWWEGIIGNIKYRFCLYGDSSLTRNYVRIHKYQYSTDGGITWRDMSTSNMSYLYFQTTTTGIVRTGYTISSIVNDNHYDYFYDVE